MILEIMHDKTWAAISLIQIYVFSQSAVAAFSVGSIFAKIDFETFLS